MTIIREAEHHEHTTYRRRFDYADRPPETSGFVFPCDEQGEVVITEDTRSNWLACLSGAVGGRAVIDRGVETTLHRWRTPRMGRCECGEEIELDHFTNTCPRCSRDYNSAGQELAPRDQWGEETGESAADILMGADRADAPDGDL